MFIKGKYMTREQQKHKEEYEIQKKKYEDAYSEKMMSIRQLEALRNNKQAVINQINSKNSESKQVSEAQEKLAETNNKDSAIISSVNIAGKNLSEVARQFKSIGTSSRGNQKDLEAVFESKNKSSNKSINGAIEKIKNAKKTLSDRNTVLTSEIKALNDNKDDIDRNITKYMQLIDEADSKMRSASISMAYHKKHMIMG